MVSLYELSQRLQNSKRAFSTGMSSLDSLLPKSIGNGGIYSVHAVPGVFEQYKVISNVICSHLEDGEDSGVVVEEEIKSVVIIDTLHPFPWHLIKENEKFRSSMLQQISWYTVGTFTKLYTLIEQVKEKNRHSSNKSLLIINNFYELVDLYKMEISSSQEEALLKHQIDVNSTLLSNLEKIKEEGMLPQLPAIPPNSDLLREPPSKKFDSHMSTLSNSVLEYVRQNSHIVFLMGYLDTYFTEAERPVSSSMSPAPSSQSVTETSFNSIISQQNQHLQQQPPQQPQPLKPFKKQRKLALAAKPSPVDKYITCRLTFFKTVSENIEVHIRVRNYSEDRRGEVIVGSSGAYSDGGDYIDEEEEDDLSVAALQPQHAAANFLPSSPDLTDSQAIQFRNENIGDLEHDQSNEALDGTDASGDHQSVSHVDLQPPTPIARETSEKSDEVAKKREVPKAANSISGYERSPTSSPLSELPPSEIPDSQTEAESQLLL